MIDRGTGNAVRSDSESYGPDNSITSNAESETSDQNEIFITMLMNLNRGLLLGDSSRRSPRKLSMSELRRFRAEDLFRFNPINLDRLTETYNLQFYLSYMATWPDLFLVQHAPSPTTPKALSAQTKNLTLDTAQAGKEGRMMGYLMGKLEGRGTDWHSHVTAITVSPEYRRLGLAKGMMEGFEQSSDLSAPPEKFMC